MPTGGIAPGGGTNLLHLACMRGRPVVIAALLNEGADPTVQIPRGSACGYKADNPLHLLAIQANGVFRASAQNVQEGHKIVPDPDNAGAVVALLHCLG
jgi:hypothetical protein